MQKGGVSNVTENIVEWKKKQMIYEINQPASIFSSFKRSIFHEIYCIPWWGRSICKTIVLHHAEKDSHHPVTSPETMEGFHYSHPYKHHSFHWIWLIFSNLIDSLEYLRYFCSCKAVIMSQWWSTTHSRIACNCCRRERDK